ncbi:EboA domain-containing protein [Streptomyces sp. DSM 44917]|uniref:EboA domain-containing protein n=1 Tax=Streptomyces boetiae TaxID=3075541 RepID=A0ABU2L749_9ACTN|nr:EboA domain-containing protein [Streptomyces sp. DSM 44917]MDT0307396.1 EboA domain-containing protein [Streptomyces sp. DSM 44917]
MLTARAPRISTLAGLREALTRRAGPEAADWLAAATREIGAQPAALHRHFPEAGRRCGRGALEPAEETDRADQADAPAEADGLPAGLAWTVDDAARALLLAAVPLRGAELAARASAVYHEGDAAERRGVLRALSLLDVGEHALPLVRDALRTDDARLLAAALGPYAARNLDPHTWRHAVLKCLHRSIPLAAVDGVVRRRDGELRRMACDYAVELTDAGRPVPSDLWFLTGHLPRS